MRVRAVCGRSLFHASFQQVHGRIARALRFIFGFYVILIGFCSIEGRFLAN